MSPPPDPAAKLLDAIESFVEAVVDDKDRAADLHEAVRRGEARAALHSVLLETLTPTQEAP